MDDIKNRPPMEVLPEVQSFVDEFNCQERIRRYQEQLKGLGGRRSVAAARGPLAVQDRFRGAFEAASAIPSAGREAAGGDAPKMAPPISIQVSKSDTRCQQRTYDGIPVLQAGLLAKRLGRYSASIQDTPKRVEFLRSRDDLGKVGKVPTKVRADRLEACGNWLAFDHFYTHPEQLVKLGAGNFCCQHLMCPLCALKRAAKMMKAYTPKIMTAIEAGMRAYMMTLSQPVGPDLRTQAGLLHGYLGKLVERVKVSRRLGRRKRVHLQPVNAGVLSMEVKRAEGTRGQGGWHVHSHGLLITDGELNTEAFRREWVDVTGGLANVEAQDVQPVHSMTLFDSEDRTEEQLVEGLGGDLLEVFKYPLKFASMEPADCWEAQKVFLGRRLIRPFGRLKGLEPAERFLPDELQLEDMPYVRLIFKHMEGKYIQERRIFT